MPKYQTNNYALLHIKEKISLINLNRSWIKHESYTHTNVNKQTYIYICIHTHTHTHTHTHKTSRYTFTYSHIEKITTRVILNHSNTHTHTVSNIKSKWGVNEAKRNTLKKGQALIKKNNNQLKTIQTANTNEFKSLEYPIN